MIVKKVNDTNISIEIIDSGTGIPIGVRDKLFEPFYTTKVIGKGTGLGLSISHEIISDHGGTLRVDDLNKNTCFKITLPLAY
jgi:two-component system sensor histidine kinase HupT/HoxJ